MDAIGQQVSTNSVASSYIPTKPWSLQTYDALAHHVTNVNMNRRLKTVSLWSLHLTANAVVASLRNIADPVSTALRDIYLTTEHVYEQTPT